ncbi:hypothetical protein ACS0TY_014171 [Phlomoides rotata]
MSIVSIILVQTYDDVVFGHTFQSAWACHDLLEVLCQLSERGHASFVRSILVNPLSYCPEVLPLGMAHVNTAYSLIQNEVTSVVLPVILKQAIILQYYTKCFRYFTDSAFKGNPAAVCLLEEERDEEWLQAVACEFNISETCYLTRLTDSPDSPNGPVPRFLLRWFTHVAEVKHLILLSETPSLSRRGLLEQTKFEFVKTYCNVKLVRGCQEKLYQVVEVIKEVNTWADKETNSLIKEILPSDSVDATTRLIFANAKYFKGVRDEKFDASVTKDHAFFFSLKWKFSSSTLHEQCTPRDRTATSEQSEFSIWDRGVKPIQVAQTTSNQFGLSGLLSVIRMSDPDLTSLALGIDLTTLGLNLNSIENLHKMFGSPWSDEPAKGDPEFTVPHCYHAKNLPPLSMSHFVVLIVVCFRFLAIFFFLKCVVFAAASILLKVPIRHTVLYFL